MKVSERARTAAADLLDELSNLLDHNGIGQVADLIRLGDYDEHAAVEAFARYENDDVLPWRPISTAPKNGKEILILAHGMAIQARYCPGRWSDDTPISPAEYDGAVWCAFDDAIQFEIEEGAGPNREDFHGQVTHWMPLMKKPQVETDV